MPAVLPRNSSRSGPLLPRWVRVADVICVLLVVVTGVIAISGGFRLWFGPVRLAITSPYRLLIWPAIIAVIRHAIVPSPPIYRTLADRIAEGMRQSSVRNASAVFWGTRPAILLVGYLAVLMFGYASGSPPWRLVQNEAANLQVRWDTGWYLGIAIDGYSYDQATAVTEQKAIVFFPAYPLLIRLVGRFFGGASTAYVLGGTLISLAAFFGALVYLYLLTKDLLDDEETATQALWLIAAYPFALFFGAIYTESLYLLGAAGAFYHLRRREFLKCGAWGLLVGLTRPNGCFLSIPLALIAVAPWMPAAIIGGARRALSEPTRRPLRSVMAPLAAAAMPGVGVLLYSAFIWSLTGNPIAWAEGHAAWGRQYQGFTVITDWYQQLSTSGVYAYTANSPGGVLPALAALFVVVASWPVARRLGLPYAVFILINILPPLAVGGLLSVGRFTSVLFPAFIWLAAVVPVRSRTVVVTTFMAAQAFHAGLFYTWRPLY